MTADARGLAIRDLSGFDEFRRVMALEQEIWGFTDMVDLFTVPVFAVTLKRGAILIGAFVDEVMIGFAYSLVGMKGGRPMQWSHMVGVTAPYRASGIGRVLKLAQRDRALAAGFDLVEWTFDPLQAVNAHFNIAALGCVAEEYARDVYGASTSPLHRGTPTDRLIVQWHIAAPPVVERLARRDRDAGQELAIDTLPGANRVDPSAEWRACAATDLTLDATRLRVTIPADYTAMQQRAPSLALDWRMATRELFEHYLTRGYRIVDFAFDRAAAVGHYVLERRTDAS